MVTFDIASDLHIDSFTAKDCAGIASVDFATLKNPDSDVLLIAGDIANVVKKTKKMLKKAAQYYAHVLFIDGNHEHYGSRIGRPISFNERMLREFSSRHPEIIYLSHADFRMGGTVFVGTNGWYDWQIMCPELRKQAQYDDWMKYSNDRFINTDIPIDVRANIHTEDLLRRVQQHDADPTIGEIVVATHTIPLRMLVDEKTFPDPLSGSYANSQMVSVLNASKKITIWVYGHSHLRRMVTHNGVTFVNNARGYGFDQDKSGQWFLVQLDSAGY